MQKKEKFYFWCFKPSNKALYNFVLYGFAIYGIYTLGIISLLMEGWHSIGHELLAFLVIYYMTYELFEFWKNWKINQFTKGFGETLLKKFLYIDEKINADLFEEVDGQISCLSKNLQVLLMKLTFPEAKARKITVKKAGFFLLKIPVYIIVFVVIILWDIFYKNLIPAIWDLLSVIVNFISKWSIVVIFKEYIASTDWYKAFVVWKKENKVWARILVTGFVFIFVLMEFLKISALAKITQGDILMAVSFYVGGTALFFVVHPYLEKFKTKMMTINWFKIRYDGVISLMEIFESTNSYKKVMAQLAKVKAIIKTVWKQLMVIFSVIRQIFSAYTRNLINYLRSSFGLSPLEETESVNLLEEIKREHDSVWKKLNFSMLTSFFMKLPNNYKVAIAIMIIFVFMAIAQLV